MKNLLVSFSGGETSGFMAQWLKNHYRELGYENIVFVFANTGLENEQTLEFVERCDSKFELKLNWVEALVYQEENKGTGFTITNYEYAKRKGEPFEEYIKKYGIPNIPNPSCTRELKLRPITSFAKSYFGKEKYHTAIGIRRDESDRMNADYKNNGIIYPLISDKMIPMTKPMINFYWKSMPFRLDLKGYQGNCITCWKKSDKKLFQIAKENPSAFDFMNEMEEKYGNYFPAQRHEKFIISGKEIPNNITFFRNNRSAKEILEQSKNWNGKVLNDADVYNYQLDLIGGESCEVWSECGS